LKFIWLPLVGRLPSSLMPEKGLVMEADMVAQQLLRSS
jgi:hypothetical protein